MKFLSTVIVTISLIYGGWTYYNLYELTAALIENNDRELALRVDLEQIRAHYAMAHSETFRPSTVHPNSIIRRAGDTEAETETSKTLIDMEWVRRNVARPANERIGWPDFAFFEEPTRLLIRYGKLGKEPVHAYMTLEDWQWRLSAIYD